MNAVETEELTKTYRGNPTEDRSWGDALVDVAKRAIRRPEDKVVLDAVSLDVRQGEMFGIVGSNGAGKTTVLKLLSCLVYPDRGRACVNGYDLVRQRSAVRRSVVIAKAGGWMSTLWQLSGRENLMFRGKMCGLSTVESRKRTEYVLDRLELQQQADGHSWSWSAGELQKFSLGLCFMGRTPLVLLDEPTSHLDPHVSRLVREFVREDLNREAGQTVLMSTHYLEEADQMCDRVAVFYQGKVLACDRPAALKARYAPDSIDEFWVTGYRSGVGTKIRERLGITEIVEHFEDVATGRARLRPKWEGRPPRMRCTRHWPSMTSQWSRTAVRRRVSTTCISGCAGSGIVRPLTRRQQSAAIWVFVKRDMSLLTRFKASYFTGLMGTVQQLIIYAMIARFGRALAVAHGIAGGYVDFVLTGLALNVLLSAALTGPYLGLMDSFWSNRIEILLASPLRLPGFVMGLSIGKFVDAAIQVAVILCGGWIFFGFVWPSGTNILLFVCVLIPALAAVIGLGLAAAGMVYLLDARGGQDPVQFAVQTISSLVAGVYFPIQVLPAGVRWLCYLVPQTYALDGMRRALFGGRSVAAPPLLAHLALSPFVLDVLILLAYAALALPFGWLIFRHGMEKARIDGRLSRWL